MSYHNFRSAPADSSKCIFCNLPETEHTCSVCGNKEKQLQKMAGMLYCAECVVKEEEAQRENEKLAKERVEQLRIENERKAQDRINNPIIPLPDTSIQVATDIFNAKIAALEDIRKEIEADSTIENKHFELAKRLEARYTHFKQIIIDAQKAEKDAQHESRTILTYYNDLAKKLKEDERAQIKLNDTQYQPPAKPTKPVKAPSVKKYSKAEIREAAAKSGIPEQMLTMICLQRNCSVAEAIQAYAQVMKG